VVAQYPASGRGKFINLWPARALLPPRKFSAFADDLIGRLAQFDPRFQRAQIIGLMTAGAARARHLA
jgi:hypothetical protein